MTSLINDSVALSQVLAAQAGGRLPLASALYACSEVARLVALEHEMGRTVTGLDPDHIRCTKAGGVILAGARVHHPDTRADVFAVGGIFYRLLTGKAPAARDVIAPSQLNPGVDSELDAVILAALASDPTRRPASLRVLEGSLAAVFEELELTASPEGLASVVATIPKQVAAPVAAAKPAQVVAAKPVAVIAAKPAPVVAKPAAPFVPKAAAAVARPIIVSHAPPAGWYAMETIDDDENENDYRDDYEEPVSMATGVPSWQTQERERKVMVGVSAAMVLIALLWALWPAPKSNRASLDNTPPARVTARR